MLVLKSNYLRLKTLFRRYRLRKFYQIKDYQRKINTLKSVLKECQEKEKHLQAHKKECMQKVIKLRETNEKIRKNYQKLSNQKMELQIELKEIKEKYDDLKKSTFGYNFFAKVASKQMLREALGKDKK